MAEIKNLFVGCPVVVKGRENDGPRIVVHIDAEELAIYALSLKTQYHARFAPDDLKLIPFLDPEKVLAHINRFKQIDLEPKVGDRFRVKCSTGCLHYFSIGEEVELIHIEDDEIHNYKSTLSGKTQYINLQDLESI